MVNPQRIVVTSYRGKPSVRKTGAVQKQRIHYDELKKVLRPREYKKYFVPIYAYDSTLVMEYLDPREWVTLGDFRGRDPSDFSIYALVKNLLGCVALLQTHKIAHTDLHDGNILISKAGDIRVIDLEDMRVNADNFDLARDMDNLWSLLYFIFDHSLDLGHLKGPLKKHEIVRHLVGIDIANYEPIDLQAFMTRARHLNFYRSSSLLSSSSSSN